MHILYLTFHLPNPREPGASRPWEELQLMRELGHRVTVITASAHYLTGDVARPPRWLWRSDLEDGIRIIRTWSPQKYRTSSLRRLLCYLSYSVLATVVGAAVNGVEAIFAGTDPPFVTPGAYILSRLHQSRLILDERDVFPETVLALGMRPPSVLVSALSVWNRWLRLHASSVITVSPGLVKLLAGRGAPVDRTFLIPNYFPPQHANGAHSSVCETENRGWFVVLYVGGLGQGTRVDVCLDAAEILQQRGYDRVRFVFQGAGERRDEYVDTCARRGLLNVEFRAAVPRAALDGVFAAATVGFHALPAHPYWRNALSSKVFEYMARGKPVLFAGEGDIAEMLRASGGGVSVPPEDAAAVADAIAWLFDHPDNVSEMGRAARKYVEQCFSRDQIRRRLSDAISVSAITSRPSGRNG